VDFTYIIKELKVDFFTSFLMINSLDRLLEDFWSQFPCKLLFTSLKITSREKFELVLVDVDFFFDENGVYLFENCMFHRTE
jgi:hypothetical protein